MKRAFQAIALILLLSVVMTACGSKTKASERAVSVGKSAIEIADEYLDSTVSADRARDRLDELKEKMEYVDTEDKAPDTHTADFSISTNLVLLSHKILMDDYDGIKEIRNELAEAVGVKKR